MYKKNVDKDFSQLSRDKKIAYIKDKKWLYEKEYRIVFDKSEESGLIFESGNWYISVKVTNIYLGVNFDRNSTGVKSEIIEACRRNNVSIKRMVLSDNDYSVKPQKWEGSQI